MKNDSPHVKAAKAPRRKNRCMYRDAQGFWWLDYYNPSGQRRRKKVSKRKSDADRLLHSIRGSINAGEYIDGASSPTFREFADIFMERHGNHKSSYVRNPRVLVRLKDFFGETRLTKITNHAIEQYRIERRTQPSCRDKNNTISLVTVNREIEVCRSVLARAVKWGFLSKNPAAQVEDFDEDNKRERFLSNHEIRRLLKATKASRSPILRCATYLALETGMRKGELLSLKWTDINFENWKILCRETKTGEPRHVPLSRRAAWVLRKRAARAPLSIWVFESKTSDGTPAPATDTKTAWQTALHVARIDDFHFHDLRHTFASNFAMKGGNLYALAEILGHSNPVMTLKRYTHLSPAFINEQRRVMDTRAFTADGQ